MELKVGNRRLLGPEQTYCITVSFCRRIRESPIQCHGEFDELIDLKTSRYGLIIKVFNYDIAVLKTRI